MIRLLFIYSTVILTGLMAQNMTQTAVKRYFKYTDANGLKNITTKMNNAKDGPICKKQCNTFANSKQFIGSGITVNKTDPLSKPAAASTACQSFCAHRFAFRKFVNLIRDRLINKKFSTLAAKVKALFFSEDKLSDNYFMKTMSQTTPKLMALPPPEKLDLFMDTIAGGMQAFSTKFPTAAMNLFGYREPGEKISSGRS